MGFENVEVESVKKIETTDWDSEVIIRAYKNKKLYRYYYVSLIGGGWRVLNRKPNEKAAVHQIQQEGLELQNHPSIRLQFVNNDFK
jgi:hypothetical protein